MERQNLLKLNKRRFLRPAREEVDRPIYTLMATLSTMVLLLIVYAIFRASPFGDRQIFLIDQFHQYSPFMAELRRKILNGESILYSWNGGLGYNMWSMIGYYLASPFNLFLLLFPAQHLSEAVLFLTVLKISLTAGTMQVFLARGFRKAPLAAAGFGVAYGLSTFVMAYAWNIMWLDVLLFLPLAALGLIRLIRREGRLLYIFALALMIWSNFYVAGFACAFLALFYPALWLRFAPPNRRTRGRATLLAFADFAFSSLLAGALTAILLIPTVLNLGLTSASDDQPPQVISFFHDAALHLGRALPFNKPAVMSGLPNIYVGLAPLLLLPIYLGNKRIPKGAKVASLALLGFLFLSFNNNWLNFAWHAFHYPNSLNHRFAFLFSFLLLFVAFDALAHTRRLRPGQLGTTAGILMLLAFILQLNDSTEETAAISHTTLIVMAIALPLLVWAIARYVRDRGPSRRLKPRALAWVALPLALVMIGEAGANMFYAHYERNKGSSFGPKEGYAYGVLPDELRDVSGQIARDHPNELVRSEVVPPLTTNDGAIYDLHGLSIFASTYPEAPIDFFENLGYRTNGVNSIAYRGSPIMLDNLLGIRYVINKDENWYPSTPWRQEINQQSRITVYENQDALSLGLFTPRDPRELITEGLDPFTAQNLLVQALDGEAGLMELVPELEQYVSVDPLTGHAAETYHDPGGRYSISQTEETFRAIVPTAGYYTIAWASSDAAVNRLTIVSRGDEQQVANHRDGMQELGYYEAGEELVFRFQQSEERHATLRVYLARMNDTAYSTTMERFRGRQMQMTEYDGNGFRGTISAPESGYVFFTLPYDPGWSFHVDRVEVPVLSVDDALMAFELDEGEHTIEAVFVPRGFTEGAAISVASLLVLIILIVLNRRQRKYRRSILRLKRVRSSNAVDEAALRERFFPTTASVQLTDGVRSAPPIELD